MDSYSEAFNIVYTNLEGEEVQAIEVTEEGEGLVRLNINTFWASEPRTITLDLTVPLVTPVRYAKDEGLFGHLIRLPHSRTERFCAPLLICPFAEEIAADRRQGAARLHFSKPKDWNFEWINWYGRVRQAAYKAISTVMSSEREPTRSFLQMRLRQAISNLIAPNDGQIRAAGSWQENGSTGGDLYSGIPLTDEALILRQISEVRLGFPDVVGNDALYEALKMKFVEYADRLTDVCWTSKTHTGREMGRVFAGDPISFVTGQPMPRLLRSLNPLAQIASPARVWRELRSCGGWLTFDNPIAPPIQTALPEPFRKRTTTLMTAIIDIPDFNVFGATEQDVQDYPGRVTEGEEISLDGLLVTRTGQKALKARVTTSEVKEADQFLPRIAELEELPGFQFEEDPQEVEILADGTPVYSYQYRYSWDREIRCRYDKVKCMCGGIKGVTRPINQLYTEINGEVVPIDMVISERTALSKGAIDLFLYPLLAHAGISKVDPTWSKEQLIELAEHGLKQRDLPTDGRFPIYAARRVPMINGKVIDEETAQTLAAMGHQVWRKTVRQKVGEGIVGPLPFCRAQETEHRQSSASRGVAINSHARVLGGVPLPPDKQTESAIEKTVKFFHDNLPLTGAGERAG